MKKRLHPTSDTPHPPSAIPHPTSQTGRRNISPFVFLLIVIGVVSLLSFGVRGRRSPGKPQQVPSASGTGTPAKQEGSRIRLLIDGHEETALDASNLGSFPQSSFTDEERKEPQTGRAVREMLRCLVGKDVLSADTMVVFRSDIRNKRARLTWPEIEAKDATVLICPSGDGTHYKACGNIKGFSSRREWVQWVTSVEVVSKANNKGDRGMEETWR
ncbi:MAG: hypothetical protein GW893_06125 [Armatimonadetes bacterium]|nr:hypothetical protein [Armatimonadota bacterium]